jgi:hypothetical protein
VLALRGILERKAFVEHARGLMSRQHQNGFWPAVGKVTEESIWATAVAANTLTDLSPGSAAVHKALRALLEEEPPQEAFWLWRLKFRCGFLSSTTLSGHLQVAAGLGCQWGALLAIFLRSRKNKGAEVRTDHVPIREGITREI